MGLSLAERLAHLPKAERDAAIAALPVEAQEAIADGAWSVVARSEQKAPPGEWLVWFYRAGRGAGKTRSAAEWVRERVEWLAAQGVDRPRGALVSRKLDDVRQTMMEGESGLASILPPSLLINGSWEDSFSRGVVELRLTNGAYLKGYSSQVPTALRGPQHHLGWLDEPASLKDAALGTADDTTWSNLLFGMRLPPEPRMVVSGTPKNTALIHGIRGETFTVETTGTTYDNLANLAPIFLDTVVRRYEGTRLGRQELHADLLADTGTLFQRSWFEVIPEMPARPNVRWMRAWDLAASEESDSNMDPDWTVGALVGFDPDSRDWFVRHIDRRRLPPGSRDDRIREVARTDRLPYQHVEQEGGSGGKAQVASLDRHLRGVAKVRGYRPTGSKEVRAQLVAGPAEQGRVFIVEGDWNLTLLDELEEFPAGSHDDQVDALAMAFELLDRGGAPASSGVNPADQAPIARPVGRRAAAIGTVPRVSSR